MVQMLSRYRLFLKKTVISPFWLPHFRVEAANLGLNTRLFFGTSACFATPWAAASGFGFDALQSGHSWERKRENALFKT